LLPRTGENDIGCDEGNVLDVVVDRSVRHGTWQDPTGEGTYFIDADEPAPGAVHPHRSWIEQREETDYILLSLRTFELRYPSDERFDVSGGGGGGKHRRSGHAKDAKT
jgi:hypothetical protein